MSLINENVISLIEEAKIVCILPVKKSNKIFSNSIITHHGQKLFQKLTKILIKPYLLSNIYKKVQNKISIRYVNILN